MNICGREYRLVFEKEEAGGYFSMHGRNSEGDGRIGIGNYKDFRFCAEILCHEIVEAILCEDRKRLAVTESEFDTQRVKFLFDHDYLDGFGPKLLTALLSSGCFKIHDVRRDMAKAKKKGKGKKGEPVAVPKKGKGKKK